MNNTILTIKGSKELEANLDSKAIKWLHFPLHYESASNVIEERNGKVGPYTLTGTTVHHDDTVGRFTAADGTTQGDRYAAVTDTSMDDYLDLENLQGGMLIFSFMANIEAQNTGNSDTLFSAGDASNTTISLRVDSSSSADRITLKMRMGPSNPEISHFIDDSLGDFSYNTPFSITWAFDRTVSPMIATLYVDGLEVASDPITDDSQILPWVDVNTSRKFAFFDLTSLLGSYTFGSNPNAGGVPTSWMRDLWIFRAPNDISAFIPEFSAQLAERPSDIPRVVEEF